MRRAGFTALATMLLALATVATAGVRDRRPNLIGGELGGRGVVLTLNYERFLSNQVGLGAGLMAIGTGGGTIVIMPLYASLLAGDVHSLYVSAGGTLLAGGGPFWDFESVWLVQTSFGYQYQSPGGLFVRPFFTYMSPMGGDARAFLIWPGLTIGGSF